MSIIPHSQGCTCQVCYSQHLRQGQQIPPKLSQQDNRFERFDYRFSVLESMVSALRDQVRELSKLLETLTKK
jgi:flagellar capping protein FliD